MKTQRQLVNNVVGQVEAVGRMMDENRDCEQVVIQMKAAQAALKSLMDKYVQDNLESCLQHVPKIEYHKASTLITQLIKA